MRKVLLSLLAVIAVLGLFAATGYAGYRFGYAQGVRASVNNNDDHPGLRPLGDFGPRGMPRHRFGFEHGWGRGGFPIRFGLFAPLMFLGRIVILALFIWFVYWLLTRSNWRLTHTTQTTASPPRNTENE